MDSMFTIDFDWIDRISDDTINRYTLAELKIAVGESIATELQDISAKSVRPTMRGSAYDMAVWFLQNWWRLVYEPERNTLDWRMSHCLGAIGNGFLWPDLRFVSNGSEMKIESQPTPSFSQQMVRYLNTIHEIIPLDEFRTTVLTFADAVLERLRETGTTSSLLHDLREDVREEESDPQSRQWRQIEALLGYDPDEAANATIEMVISEAEKYGTASINELIAFSGREPGPIFEWLADSASAAGSPVIIPDSALLRDKTAKIDSSLLPWERAEIAARLAKTQWSLAENTISNRQLKEVFALKNGILTDHHGDAPLSLAFRNGDSDCIQATLTSPHESTRRFTLLRVVADHLYSPASDHLLPVTKAKTARQQFQKAFAQEFLCPSHELITFMDDDFSDERLEDAASHFNVSSLVVKTTLVNKGLLGRYEISDQWVR
ncbi:MAG: hypothetical protein HGB33_04115 [Syntrophaceae bacterium]|nr:hypothetical protein [Syntrophaceae bacterium]